MILVNPIESQAFEQQSIFMRLQTDHQPSQRKVTVQFYFLHLHCCGYFYVTQAHYAQYYRDPLSIQTPPENYFLNNFRGTTSYIE